MTSNRRVGVNGYFTEFLSPVEQARAIAQALPVGLDRRRALSWAVQEVHQRVRWISDEEARGRPEAFEAPDRTLADGIGDCEDQSFVLAAILNALPEAIRPEVVRVTIGVYRPSFFMIPAGYHAWTEAQSGKKWYILDPTSGRLFEAPSWTYDPIISIYSDRIEFH